MEVRGRRILVLGDSLSMPTPGTPGYALGESLVANHGARSIKFNAKVGRSARSFMESENGKGQLRAASQNVDAAIVMLGTNDAASGGDDIRSFRAIGRVLAELNIPFVVIGPPAFSPDAETLGKSRAKMAPRAQRLGVLLKDEFGSRFVDAVPYSSDILTTGEGRSRDLIHFSREGAQVFGSRLAGAAAGSPGEMPPEIPGKAPIAFGSHPAVSAPFAEKVRAISRRLGIDPDWLMAVMYHESAGTFSPSKRNPSSGATGLIQFIGSTAAGLLGIKNTKDGRAQALQRMASMSQLEQLDYVEKYLAAKGPMRSLDDVSSAVFAGHVADPGEVLFRQGSDAYDKNTGTDKNKDGAITAEEVWGPYRRAYKKGTGREYYAVPRPASGGVGAVILVLLGCAGMALAKWNGLL